MQHWTVALSSPPVFSGVRVTRSLVLYVCFVDRCLFFCTFSFGHCVVSSSSSSSSSSSIYGFWLPLWYLQALLTLIKMTRLSPHSNTMTSRKSSPTENMSFKFAPFFYHHSVVIHFCATSCVRHLVSDRLLSLITKENLHIIRQTLAILINQDWSS